MIRASGIAAASSRLPEGLILTVARRWRDALDHGHPVQCTLHATLEPHGYGMLAPAFDSLMRLCESRFDHRLCTGCLLAPTADEHVLCRLLADPALLDRMGPCRAGKGLDRAFATALRSVRIMLAMADADTDARGARLQ